MRCARTPQAQWGKKLLARKGSVNLAVAAVALKLAVAAWNLMMGLWTPLEEIDERLCIKVTKVIGQVGQGALNKLGHTRKALREQAYALLKARKSKRKTYVLDLTKKFTPKPKAKGLALEYGLV